MTTAEELLLAPSERRQLEEFRRGLVRGFFGMAYAERQEAERMLRARARAIPRTVELRDGTVGYVAFPRRDQCWATAVASCLQVPLEEIPDPEIDRRLAAGADPEAVNRSMWREFHAWLAEIGYRMVEHRSPAAARRRAMDRGRQQARALRLARARDEPGRGAVRQRAAEPAGGAPPPTWTAVSASKNERTSSVPEGILYNPAEAAANAAAANPPPAGSVAAITGGVGRTEFPDADAEREWNELAGALQQDEPGCP